MLIKELSRQREKGLISSCYSSSLKEANGGMEIAVSGYDVVMTVIVGKGLKYVWVCRGACSACAELHTFHSSHAPS